VRDTRLPLNAAEMAVVFVAVGAILGALAFSLVVGRSRARQLARLADRLALAGLASPEIAVRYPDRVLSDSVERLVARIADVEALASTDPLTRLLNRLACLQTLAAEIERANRYARPLAIALIDIDHFKQVNDTHGHAIGDEVLRHVPGCSGRTFAPWTASADTVARSSSSSCPRPASTARSRRQRTCGA